MNLSTLTFESSSIRSVLQDGEPWFVASDVCDHFAVTNRYRALQAVEPDDKGSTQLDTPGGTQNFTIINEAGLYALLFSLRPGRARGIAEEQVERRREQLRRFKSWITHDVLPSIRQTGSYTSQRPKSLEEQTLEVMNALTTRVQEQQAELEAARPAVAYVERYVADDDVLTVKAWAAQFEMTEPQARELLTDRGILYRKRIGRRWSASRQQMVDVTEWRAYAGFIGLFDLRPQHNAPRHHNGQVKQTLYVRQARALDLAAALGMTHQVQSLDLTA